MADVSGLVWGVLAGLLFGEMARLSGSLEIAVEESSSSDSLSDWGAEMFKLPGSE